MVKFKSFVKHKNSDAINLSIRFQEKKKILTIMFSCTAPLTKYEKYSIYSIMLFLFMNMNIHVC